MNIPLLDSLSSPRKMYGSIHKVDWMAHVTPASMSFGRYDQKYGEPPNEIFQRNAKARNNLFATFRAMLIGIN